MNIVISRFGQWLDDHPRIKQWLWFIGLWFGGLLTVVTAAYPIKWLIHTMK